MTTFAARIAFILLVVQILVPRQMVHGQQTTNVTVKVPYKKKSYVGKPLAWDGSELMLLRRDGKISFLPVGSVDDYQTISSSFEPYPS